MSYELSMLHMHDFFSYMYEMRISRLFSVDLKMNIHMYNIIWGINQIISLLLRVLYYCYLRFAIEEGIKSGKMLLKIKGLF